MANGIKNRLEDLKSSFERLSDRERRMVSGVGVAFVFAFVVVVGYFVQSGIEGMEEQNNKIRAALRDLEQHKDAYLAEQRRIAALEVRMPRKAMELELNGFVETAAKEVGVSISESAELPAAEGKRYLQRELEIKLRKITIDQLARLMKQLENGSRYIVQITELSVNTRWNEHEDLDVEMVITTYERKQKKPSKRGNSPQKRERT